jgi:hypothetical protein
MATVRNGVGGLGLVFCLAVVQPVQAQQEASSPQPENARNTTLQELQQEEQAEVGLTQTRDLVAGEDVDERVTPNVVPSPEIVVRQPERDLFQVELGGGVGSYTANLGNTLEGGVAWGVRGIVGAKYFVGLELGYEGTANNGERIGIGEPLDGPDAAGEPVFATTGEALARINMAGPNAMFRPYIAGGAGYFRLDSDAAALDELEALSFPLAAGLQMFPYKDVTVGLRGNLRLLTDYLDDDFPTGNQYGGLLSLGTTF